MTCKFCEHCERDTVELEHGLIEPWLWCAANYHSVEEADSCPDFEPKGEGEG